MNNLKLESAGNYIFYGVTTTLRLELQKGLWFYFTNIPVKPKDNGWIGRISENNNFAILESINKIRL